MKNQEELALSILKKIKLAGGEDAISAFIESKGEKLPAVKLSPLEMEFLKGGNFTTWLCTGWRKEVMLALGEIGRIGDFGGKS